MNNKEIEIELQNAIRLLEELNYKNNLTLNKIKKILKSFEDQKDLKYLKVCEKYEEIMD